MKRFLLLIPVMIQPYILLFALYSIFINQYIVERFFGGNGLWLLFVIFVTIVISFICTLVYMPFCLAKGWGARQTAFAYKACSDTGISCYICAWCIIFPYNFHLCFFCFFRAVRLYNDIPYRTCRINGKSQDL